MRILHMIPDIGVANGVMSVVLNYFKSMPEDIKFDVVYFHETENNRQADIEALGGKVFKISAPGIKSVLNKEIIQLFKKNPDRWSALHIHAPHFAVFIAPVAKKFGINKIAVHCHTTTFSLHADNVLRNKILSKLGAKYIDARFACSKQAGDSWYSKYRKYTVLNNSIDCSQYVFNEKTREQNRQQLNAEDKFIVGHIGQTSIVQKNHPFILQVFEKIKQINNESVLLLIGAEETEELTDLAKSLNIENDVKFLGARTDVPQLLQAIDLFLFPSIEEGLPVSIVEAQSAGLPVLMSDAVTEEVCITDDIIRMSLRTSPEQWAKTAILMADKPRNNTFVKMANSGWDVYSQGRILSNYYNTGELK